MAELGEFPEQPYRITLDSAAHVFRKAGAMRRQATAKDTLRTEVQRRLAESSRKEVILYVHGFNETFETAAFTELCHSPGRESVCGFFTWPASSTANFLIS